MTSGAGGLGEVRLFTFGRLAVEAAEGLPEGGPRPRRLALLAILAARGSRGQTRERILAILWQHSSETRGRHALSQTLYALRQDLNREVILARPGDVLTLDPAVISSDIEDFRQAVQARDWVRASDLYAGPFAAGFSLSEAPGFEEWVDEERRRLAGEGHKALLAAARQAETEGDLSRALSHWRRLTLSDALNTRFTVGFVRTLSALGDRDSALEHARIHADLVRRELDAEPDPELRALQKLLEAPVGAAAPGSSSPAAASVGHASLRRLSTATRAAVVLTAVVLAVVLGRIMAARNTPSHHVLAVGLLRDRTSGDSARPSGVLRDMLSTNLARVSALEIIAPTWLPPVAPDSTGRALASAARHAGATEILEGDVSLHPDGLRLELRRVDLRRGRVVRGYIVAARDRFALIDSATAVLTRDLELAGPGSSVADVTTRSPLAYRLYEEGRQAFFQADWPTAGRLFRAALAEDSTFALAAIYAWRVAGETGGKDSLEPTILRLADRAPDRERLLARTLLGTVHSDPSALAMADSLEQRFPSDPDALIAAAGARLHRYGFSPAIIALLERALALDSMAGPGAMRGARVAQALHGQFDAYTIADSISAAEHILRRWMPIQPGNSTPLFHLAHLLERQGRVQEADAAYARNDELNVVKINLVHAGVWKGINRGDPGLLLESCRFGLANAHDVAQFTDYRWLCLQAYRHLGRLREAMALTRPRRLAPGPGDSGGVSVGEDGLNRIILDWMLGRPGDAARGFLGVAREQRTGSVFPGENARRESWWLTLAATAFVAARDTAAAAGLTDSIRNVGARSMYGRDPLLHHFVRGLILSVERRPEDAMAEFLLANYSWPQGYTRVNYEFARCALELGRPRDAIYPLQAALRGGLEGPQLYVTQTELHELLGQAFEAAGIPDSASSHYGYVARMWAGADRQFASRHRRAVEWLRHRGHDS